MEVKGIGPVSTSTAPIEAQVTVQKGAQEQQKAVVEEILSAITGKGGNLNTSA